MFQCFLQFSISGVMSTFKDFQLTSEEFKSSGDSSKVIGGVIVVCLNIWRILRSVCSLEVHEKVERHYKNTQTHALVSLSL